MAFKIEIDRGAGVIESHFCSNNNDDDFIDRLPAAFNVVKEKLTIYQLSDDDARYIGENGLFKMNEKVVGVDQSFTDFSEPGKIKISKKKYNGNHKKNPKYDKDYVGEDKDKKREWDMDETHANEVSREIVCTEVSWDSLLENKKKNKNRK